MIVKCSLPLYSGVKLYTFLFEASTLGSKYHVFRTLAIILWLGKTIFQFASLPAQRTTLFSKIDAFKEASSCSSEGSKNKKSKATSDGLYCERF